MKKLLLSLIALAAVAASAQDNYWAPTMLFSSESLPTKTLTNGTSSAYCTNTYTLAGKELGLQVNVKALVYVTSNITVSVSKSLDGVNWHNWTAFSLAANGTTPATWTTNFTANSIKMVRVDVSTTALYGNGLTNVSVYATSR